MMRAARWATVAALAWAYPATAQDLMPQCGDGKALDFGLGPAFYSALPLLIFDRTSLLHPSPCSPKGKW